MVDASRGPDADLAGFNRAFITAATFAADVGDVAAAADTLWRWLTLGCDGGVGLTCLQE